MPVLYLLEHQPDLVVTEDIASAAASNEQTGKKIMQTLLEHQGPVISSDVARAAHSDLSTSVASTEHVEHRFFTDTIISMLKLAFQKRLRRAPFGVTLLRFLRPALRPGFTRSERTCTCGVLLYDDYEISATSSRLANKVDPGQEQSPSSSIQHALDANYTHGSNQGRSHETSIQPSIIRRKPVPSDMSTFLELHWGVRVIEGPNHGLFITVVFAIATLCVVVGLTLKSAVQGFFGAGTAFAILYAALTFAYTAMKDAGERDNYRTS